MAKKLESQEVYRCAICNKTISREQTVGVGQGHRCTKVQKANGKSVYILVNAQPEHTISVAELGRKMRSAKTKFPKLSVNHLVKSFGTDRGIEEIAHPVFQVFVFHGQRFISDWLATEAGLKTMASRDYSKVPETAIRKVG